MLDLDNSPLITDTQNHYLLQYSLQLNKTLINMEAILL